MEDINNGNLSTWILTLALVILGVFAQNPSFLNTVLGDSGLLKFSAFIVAALLAFYNYYYPRLQKLVETGEEIKWDNGKISTFLATTATLVIGVYVTNPDLLNNVLMELGYAQYIPIIGAIIIAAYNFKFPRNEQSQLTESQDIAGEPVSPEIFN